MPTIDSSTGRAVLPRPDLARRAGRAILCLSAAILAFGCGGPVGEDVAGLPDAGLLVEDAKAHRMGAVDQGAVYFRVLNGDDRDDRLLAVETEDAKVAEIHETVDDDGVMRMRAFPDGLSIPARSTVAFEPGGKHVMLIGTPPEEVTTVELVLVFENAGRIEIEAPFASFQ